MKIESIGYFVDRAAPPSAEELWQKRDDLTGQIMDTKQEILNLVEEVSDLRKREDEMRGGLWEVYKMLNELGEDGQLYLVHANFRNEIQGIWYTTSKVAKELKKGDIVMVETDRGATCAIVDYVEPSTSFGVHKRVIKKVR